MKINFVHLFSKMKKKYLFIFFFSSVILFLFVFFNKDQLQLFNIQNFLIYYQKYKFYIDENKLLFATIYLFFSILWICLLGIMIPMLILATLMFEYLGIVLSIISFSIGSTISYIFAKKFKNLISKKIDYVTVKKNSFFLYIIFRFIPGIPYILKNISGIFFKLRNRDFFAATIISDTPQIFLIVFLIKKLVDSTEIFNKNFDILLISKELFLPIFLIVLFLIFVFLIKVKFSKNFIKNNSSF